MCPCNSDTCCESYTFFVLQHHSPRPLHTGASSNNGSNFARGATQPFALLCMRSIMLHPTRNFPTKKKLANQHTMEHGRKHPRTRKNTHKNSDDDNPKNHTLQGPQPTSPLHASSTAGDTLSSKTSTGSTSHSPENAASASCPKRCRDLPFVKKDIHR